MFGVFGGYFLMFQKTFISVSDGGVEESLQVGKAFEPVARIFQQWAEEQIPWESYRLEKAFNSNIAKHLGIEAIPFIVLIDKQGKIAAKNPRDEELIDKINELLK